MTVFCVVFGVPVLEAKQFIFYRIRGWEDFITKRGVIQFLSKTEPKLPTDTCFRKKTNIFIDCFSHWLISLDNLANWFSVKWTSHYSSDFFLTQPSKTTTKLSRNFVLFSSHTSVKYCRFGIFQYWSSLKGRFAPSLPYTQTHHYWMSETAARNTNWTH